MLANNTHSGLGAFVRGGIAQTSSTTAEPSFKESFTTEIVNNRRTLIKHLRGASVLRAVVYVTSPTELIKLLNELDVERIELVMGHQKIHDFKGEMTVDVVERLLELREQQRLSIFTSEKVHYHTKLYIAEFEDSATLINSSANLTKTGMKVKGTQINHQWVMKITGDFEASEAYEREMGHYGWYQGRTREFFGEFADLFTQTEPEKRIEITEHWLKTGEVYGAPEDVQVREVARLIIEEVMSADAKPDQTVVEIIPKAAPKAVEKVTTAFAPIGVSVESSGTMVVPIGKYCDHTLREFPMLYIDEKAQKVTLGWGGKCVPRTADEYNPSEINTSLAMFEDFVQSVDLAEPKFPELAKRSITEALLYILASPFHHHFMQLRRKTFGITEERGPRILHLFGGTRNGKSKILDYSTRLITGREFVKAQDGIDFSPTAVDNLRSWQSVFPIMFDDLTNDKWSQIAEKVIKPYWDKRWVESEYTPQLILTSNKQCPKGPLTTRVKEIVLDSTYPMSTESRTRLAEHFERENPLFEYFSKAYLEQSKIVDYSDDEAYLSRAAFKFLYEIAERNPPSWMPLNQTLEEVYDPGAVKLLKALIDNTCTVQSNGDEIILSLDESMAHWDVTPYFNAIPVDHAAERKGNRIFVRRPDRFVPWIRQAKSWTGLRRLPRRLRKVL